MIGAVGVPNISLSFINGNSNSDIITLEGVSQSTVSGGQGADFIDTLSFVTGSIINGNANADDIDILAGASSSSIFGGQGVDTIRVTGTFIDTVIQGDKDNDTIVVGNVGLTSLLNTTINGNDGNDSITVNALTSFTDSTVFGGEGGDRINAGGAVVAVYLSGDAGNDTLIGGAGADTINGGDGSDTLTGNGEKDTFLYTSVAQTFTNITAGGAGNIDVITDFTSVTLGVIQDTIKGFGLAGVAGAGGNYDEGAGGTTYTTALAAANAAFALPGTNTQYFLASYGAAANTFSAVLFIDLGSTGTAQGAIQIGGSTYFDDTVALNSLEAGNILA